MPPRAIAHQTSRMLMGRPIGLLGDAVAAGLNKLHSGAVTSR
jgi:hypothetical protein